MSTRSMALLAAAIVAFAAGTHVTGSWAAEHPQAKDLLWLIGQPDAFTWEFGLAEEGYQQFKRRYGNPIVYTVGSSKSTDWPYIHPAHRDGWAGAKAYTFTVRFQSPEDQSGPLFLLIGIVGAHRSEHSKIWPSPGIVYAAERAYWKSLWHRKSTPSGGGQ